MNFNYGIKCGSTVYFKSVEVLIVEDGVGKSNGIGQRIEVRLSEDLKM